MPPLATSTLFIHSVSHRAESHDSCGDFGCFHNYHHPVPLPHSTSKLMERDISLRLLHRMPIELSNQAIGPPAATKWVPPDLYLGTTHMQRLRPVGPPTEDRPKARCSPPPTMGLFMQQSFSTKLQHSSTRSAVRRSQNFDVLVTLVLHVPNQVIRLVFDRLQVHHPICMVHL